MQELTNSNTIDESGIDNIVNKLNDGGDDIHPEKRMRNVYYLIILKGLE